MNHDLDELLRSDGERWAESQGEPPSLTNAMHDATRKRDHRAPIAIAATVAVVAGITAIPLVRSYTGDQASPSATSSHPTRGASTRATPPSFCCDINIPVAPPELIQRAHSTAIANQDPNASAAAVLTTYRVAERTVLGGDRSSNPPGNTRVWVLQLRGHFVCGSCSHPAGGMAPRGSAIAVVIDARTYEGYDFTITKKAYDLNRIGNPIKVPL